MLHLDAVVKHEDLSPKTIVNYLIMVYSMEEYDFSTVHLCKETYSKGNYGTASKQLFYDKAGFVVDSLEIGNKKYFNLRCVLLSGGIQIPGYNQFATLVPYLFSW